MCQKPKLQTEYFQLWSDVVLRGLWLLHWKNRAQYALCDCINLREIIIFGFALECESSEC